MTAAFTLMTMAVLVLLVVIALQASQMIHLAIKARDAQIQAARILAFYQANNGNLK